MDLQEGFFDDKTEYAFKENEIAIAFGMTKFGGVVEEDISMYGELLAFYYGWDVNLTSDFAISETPVR